MHQLGRITTATKWWIKEKQLKKITIHCTRQSWIWPVGCLSAAQRCTGLMFNLGIKTKKIQIPHPETFTSQEHHACSLIKLLRWGTDRAWTFPDLCRYCFPGRRLQWNTNFLHPLCTGRSGRSWVAVSIGEKNPRDAPDPWSVSPLGRKQSCEQNTDLAAGDLEQPDPSSALISPREFTQLSGTSFALFPHLYGNKSDR